MYRKSISWLIFMFTAVNVASCYRDTDSTTEWSVTEADKELGRLLEDGDGNIVTLEAGATRLVAHYAVLLARSRALTKALEGGVDQLIVPGVEGPVLRHLVAYLYSLRVPQLPPGVAPQLLAAAHRFGLPDLQADCERQVAEQLSVETAASAAVLAVEVSADHLRDAAINFIKEHRVKVLATKGWADALENRPEEVAEVSRLLADRLAEICAPFTMGAGPTTTRETETTTNTEAGTTTTTQPHSQPSQSPGTVAQPLAACPITPLDEATVSRFRNLSGEERNTKLLQAAGDGAVAELRALLAAGADARASDGYAATALHRAAIKGCVEAASCLLAVGARVDAKQRWDWTPLELAILHRRAAMVRLLLAAGADPNTRDGGGMRPLHWAAMFGDAEVVAALLQAGADQGARDEDSRTPLDVARKNSHTQLFEMLAKRQPV